MLRVDFDLRQVLRMSVFALVLSLSLVTFAHAWDVTFTKTPGGNRSSSSFNLRVVLEQPLGVSSAKRGCRIGWNQSECTIEDFPSSSNALVTVYHSTNQFGGQRNVIGKIQFWVSVFRDSEIHIPSGVASFKTDKTWNELASKGGMNISILPQANIEMGESFSDRPNGGTSYFGQLMGNCGSRDLASDQPEFSCQIDYLAGCYSPVFARPASSPSKAVIWVNRTDESGDHALCLGNGEVVDYLIKVR